jgi:vacuolar-type H+-ATPase subunit I/STV1
MNNTDPQSKKLKQLLSQVKDLPPSTPKSQAETKKILEFIRQRQEIAPDFYNNSHTLYEHIRKQVFLINDIQELRQETLEYFSLILSELPDEIVKRIGKRACQDD